MLDIRYGIYVNEDGGIPYAQAIVEGCKPIETRNRNMLGKLIGKRVAVIRTRRGKNPLIVGFVTIDSAEFRSAEWLDAHRDQTLIPPGSRHDCTGKGKWCYTLSNPWKMPFILKCPSWVVKHGRSYCEF